MLNLMHHLESRRLLAGDLICVSLSVTSFDESSGLLKWQTTVTNTSSTATPNATKSKVFLSRDQVVNNIDDVDLDTIAPSDIPRTGDIRTLNGELDLTTVIPGTYYLGVALDSGNIVSETSESNNYRFASTQITVNDSFNILVEGTDSDDLFTIQGGVSIIVGLNGKAVKTLLAAKVKSVHLRGLGGNDIFTSISSLNRPLYVEGGDGNDIITGGPLADTLSGNAGKDSIAGGAANDRINGNGGHDYLLGQGGADRIYGNAGNDYLDGGGSNDRLDGGDGFDSLYGQGGDDHFFTKDNTIDRLFGGSGTDDAEADTIDVKQSIQTIIS